MKTSRRDIAIIFGVALLARILYLAVWGGFDDRIHDSMTDQYIYLDIAENLAAGDGFVVSDDTWVATPGEPTSIVPPLYPLVLGVLFDIHEPSVLSARILGLVLTALLAPLAYLIALRIFGRRTAIMAGVLAALYPPLVMYSRPIMSEVLFLPLLALLVYLSIRLLEGNASARTWALWGVVGALAVLTRSEVALLLAPLMVLMLFFLRHHGRRFLLTGVVAAGIAAIITLSPYSIYNFQAHGTWAPMPNAKWKMWDHTWWTANRSEPEWAGVQLPERLVVPDWETKTESERDAYLWDMTVEFVKEEPGTYLNQRIRRIFWSYPVVPLEEIRSARPPDGSEISSTSLDDTVRYTSVPEKVRVWSFRTLLLAAVVGFILSTRQHFDRRVLVLGLVILWNCAHSALFVGSERLRVQIDLFIIVLGAVTLVVLWDQIAEPRRAVSRPAVHTSNQDVAGS